MTNAIPQLIGYVPQIISSIVKTLTENLPQIISSAIDIILALVSGLGEALPELIGYVPEIISSMVTALLNAVPDIADAGLQLMMGLVKGIADSVSAVIQAVVGTAQAILGAVKGAFGIASPSKETAWMGKMLAEGLADGISDNAYLVNKAWGGITSSFGQMSLNAGSVGRYIGGSTFNIYQREGENASALARRIDRQMGAMLV